MQNERSLGAHVDYYSLRATQNFASAVTVLHKLTPYAGIVAIFTFSSKCFAKAHIVPDARGIELRDQKSRTNRCGSTYVYVSIISEAGSV